MQDVVRQTGSFSEKFIVFTYILVSFLFSFKKWFGLGFSYTLWGLGFRFAIGNLIGGAVSTVGSSLARRLSPIRLPIPNPNPNPKTHPNPNPIFNPNPNPFFEK